MTITGALAGRIATGCFLDYLCYRRGYSDKTATSATQNPMTTSGHRATKSPSHWKTPPLSAASVVSIRRNIRRSIVTRRNQALSTLCSGATAPQPSATRTYTDFIAAIYRATDSLATGLFGKNTVIVVCFSRRFTHTPT